jgi:CRISPR-associated protein Csd1
MILQALYRYYNILLLDPESAIAPPGYCTTGVSFALNISQEGDLLDIFPLFEQIKMGNKLIEKPRKMVVPEQVKRSSGICANFLCDNGSYVLAISDKAAKNADYAIKRFQAFREFNKNLLQKADCAPARAVIVFLDKYDPRTGRSQPAVVPNLERILEGGNLIFRFQGQDVQSDAEICRVWDEFKAGKEAIFGQCLVTGEEAPIERLHASVQGIRGGNATGASLVGFNARAYESYNRINGQGLNAPVSVKATFAYTTALKYLLSSANPNRKIYIGDTTVVYWAESEKKEYASAFANLIEPEFLEPPAGDNQAGRKKAEGRMKGVAEKVRYAQALDVSKLTEGLDPETRFYVLGLAPNAGRIAVRFFLTDPFGKIVGRIMQHYEDLEIIKEYDNQPTYISLRQMLNETFSQKSKDKEASPLMAGAVMRAILSNCPYPAAMYYALINRVRADMDDKSARISKINHVRAAMIKAYLLRKNRNQSKFQEVLVMSLNEQATTPAYVLGRLFAVLEKAQQEAIGDVNAGIKDRYFTSACASPASVFPVLLRLSQHHISKAEYGRNIDRRIQDILNLLDVEKNPIPARLSLDEQGVFVLGYYHQRAAFYAKTNTSTEATLSEPQ